MLCIAETQLRLQALMKGDLGWVFCPPFSLANFEP